MWTLPHRSSVIAAAALWTGALVILRLAGLPLSDTIQLAALLLAAIAASGLRLQQAAALDRARAPLDEPEPGVRPVGGLGLRLIAQYTECVRHGYENGRNRSFLRLRRPA